MILTIQSFGIRHIIFVKRIIFICHVEAAPHDDQSRYRQNVKLNIVFNMKNRVIHAVVQICSVQSLSKHIAAGPQKCELCVESGHCRKQKIKIKTMSADCSRYFASPIFFASVS